MIQLVGRNASVVARLFRNREFRIGAVMLAIMVLAATLGPAICRIDPDKQDLAKAVMAPTWCFAERGRDLLGTDQLGRSILSRLMYGARISLVVGLASVVVSGLVGVPVGLMAGYCGGPVDAVLMRMADVQLAFPPVLLALAIVASFGSSLLNVIVAIAITSWVPYARVIRGCVLSVKQREFVEASRALGASGSRILTRHILPNIMTPVIVVATLQVGRSIVTESALSFLGLGVPAPAASWGSMLSDARNYLFSAWWLPTFPGLAIMASVLSINFLGNGLRTVLDPKLRL